ncbi:unnamed protein product [Lathyrus oleraceus]
MAMAVPRTKTLGVASLACDLFLFWRGLMWLMLFAGIWNVLAADYGLSVVAFPILVYSFMHLLDLLLAALCSSRWLSLRLCFN